jgi:hypothetical protein
MKPLHFLCVEGMQLVVTTPAMEQRGVECALSKQAVEGSSTGGGGGGSEGSSRSSSR